MEGGETSHSLGRPGVHIKALALSLEDDLQQSRPASLSCPVQGGVPTERIEEIHLCPELHQGGESGLVLVLDTELGQTQPFVLLAASVEPETWIVQLLLDLLSVEDVSEGMNVTLLQGLYCQLLSKDKT